MSDIFITVGVSIISAISAVIGTIYAAKKKDSFLNKKLENISINDWRNSENERFRILTDAQTSFMAEVRSELLYYKKEVGILREKIVSYEKEIATLKEKISQYEGKINEYEGKIFEYELEITGLRTQVADYEKKMI